MAAETVDKANRKSFLFGEYFTESTTACLFTMVQGNVLALGVSHLLIASQTGLLAGLLATAAVIISKTTRRWVLSAIIGFTTAVVDYFVHPGMFGPVFAEAIVTGIAAAVLSYLFGTLMKRVRRDLAEAS